MADSYWRRRIQRAGWSFDFWRDTIVAAIAAALTWLGARRYHWSVLEDVTVPAFAAVMAVFLFEGIRFAWRFVFVAPKEMFEEERQRADDLQECYDGQIRWQAREVEWDRAIETFRGMWALDIDAVLTKTTQ